MAAERRRRKRREEEEEEEGRNIVAFYRIGSAVGRGLRKGGREGRKETGELKVGVSRKGGGGAHNAGLSLWFWIESGKGEGVIIDGLWFELH